MKRDLQIPKVTFRVRVGDEVETDGGCAIGGQWINKTTDDYFKGKRVVVVLRMNLIIEDKISEYLKKSFLEDQITLINGTVKAKKEVFQKL